MAHSEDLRKKVLNHILQYGSIKSAVELFEVSRSSIQRWQNKQKDSGNVAKKARKCKPYKVQDMELVDYINTNQEAYLYDAISNTKCNSLFSSQPRKLFSRRLVI